jgi:hypothetical protein
LLPQTMYSRIVDTTRIGSGSLPASKEHGQTFRRNEIVKTRSVSARICIARAGNPRGWNTQESIQGNSLGAPLFPRGWSRR